MFQPVIFVVIVLLVVVVVIIIKVYYCFYFREVIWLILKEKSINLTCKHLII